MHRNRFGFQYLLHDHAQTRGEYISSLTGLRGFAALWVLLYHAWEFSVPRAMVIDLGIAKPGFTTLFGQFYRSSLLFCVISIFAEFAVRTLGLWGTGISKSGPLPCQAFQTGFSDFLGAITGIAYYCLYDRLLCVSFWPGPVRPRVDGLPPAAHLDQSD